MKENFTALETLLNANSSFLANASLHFTQAKESKALSYKEQLVEACWNGELADILPEAFCLNDAPYLYLWNVIECDKVIALESADTFYDFTHNPTVNPYRIDYSILLN